MFVEELTKAIVEAGPCSVDSARPMPVPATLQDSLMARLDRLGSAKEVAQLGAVIGRTFDFELLAAVANTGEEDLRSATEALVHAELVLQHGTPPDARYTFKHALVQDAAYESLLRARRRDLHAHVADVLEQSFTGIVDTEPELLAHHFTEAGLAGRAIRYWLAAAQRANARSANEEAIAHSRQGLALVSEIENERDRLQSELALQTALANGQSGMGGYSWLEAYNTYERAFELCQTLGDEERAAAALLGLHGFYDIRGQHRDGEEWGRKSVELADRSEKTAVKIVAYFLRALDFFAQGEPKFGMEWFEKVTELHDLDDTPLPVSFYSEEPGLCARAWYALGTPGCFWPWDTRIADARWQNAPRTRRASLGTLGPRRTPCSGSRLYILSSAIPRRTGTYPRRHSRMLRKNASRCSPGSPESIRASAGLQSRRIPWTLRRHSAPIDSFRTDFGLWGILQSLTLLAGVQRDLGRTHAGLEACQQALELTNEINQRFYEAETHRVTGSILLAGDPITAEECFNHALAVSHHQEAKLFELRAATSLARLWRGQGKVDSEGGA